MLLDANLLLYAVDARNGTTLPRPSGWRAWRYVEAWLAADPVWVPPATERTAAVLARLIEQHDVSANLVTDAQLAALAIEHGLTVISADSDFTRFDDLSWHNPLVRV